MFAVLIAYTMIGMTPTEYILEERMDYGICVEILADHIEANAPIMITPMNGPNAGVEVALHPRQLECRPYYDA